MLSPIVHLKIVCARNAYLKAGNGKRMPAKERLLDIAGDRYDMYKEEGRPHDAARVLRLATTRKNASEAQMCLLGKIRRELLAEARMGA